MADFVYGIHITKSIIQSMESVKKLLSCLSEVKVEKKEQVYES